MKTIVRTGVSDLSDVELIVMDPMSQFRVRRRPLLAENYARSFNTPYTHPLTPGELDATLARLFDRGLLTTDPPWYGLSPAGGAVWERERAPNWDSYCLQAWGTNDDGLSDLEVIAVTRQIGEECLRLLIDHGICEPATPALVTWTLGESEIYWKPSLKMWRAALAVRQPAVERYDSTDFWKQWRRLAWSEIDDLNEAG